MEPWKNDELPEQELDRLLREWKTPPAPARLRRKIFPDRGAAPWWRRFWSISIRIPLPVACCLTIVFAAMAWRWPSHSAVESTAAPSFEVPKFQPVRELQPRIVKDEDAQ
jgi:hypothetical protein